VADPKALDHAAQSPGMDPTDSEAACFEAGIKFGSLYHQFAGTPVSPDSADSLSQAMAAAIENQPHCEQVTVDILTDKLAAALADSPAEYTELTGKYMDVEIHIDYDGTEVVSRMAMADGYPLMEVVDVGD